MIEIVEVKTKKEQAEFVDFELRLLMKFANFVPPLRGDEMKIFGSKNPSMKDCECVFLLAKKNGETVGRLGVVIQNAFNKKNNAKNARFTRFDCIDDHEVAKTMFSHAEKWVMERGMEVIHGPLGFNDLEREGLLVEGFEHLSTFESKWSLPYYMDLLEANGFTKEKDWLSFKIFIGDNFDARMDRVADAILKRYHLRVVKEKSKKEFIKKWSDEFFNIINQAYAPLLGTVPFNREMIDGILEQFKLLISLDYICAVANEENKLVAIGVSLPSLAEAVRKCKGRLTPRGLILLLREAKKTKVADLGLIGVAPEWLNRGVNAVVTREFFNAFRKNGIFSVESNITLEDNAKMLATYDYFKHKTQHKRFRSYIKKLSGTNGEQN